MSYKLIVTDKSSVAESLSFAVNATQKNKGYYSGNGYIVTWTNGHLVTLFEPEDYSSKYKKWSLEDLPLLPQKYLYKVIEDSNRYGNYKKRQFELIKALMNSDECELVIAATDASREGELIYRLIARKAECKKPTKRLWLSSLVADDIRDSLSNMKDIKEYNSLFYSAVCRERADWLYGMNLSRYFSTVYSSSLTYGRVQTVVVNMVYERDKEIATFKMFPDNLEPSYFAIVDCGKVQFSLKTDSQRDCDLILSECRHEEAKVVELSKNERNNNTPHLYNLTMLQREANRYLKMTAEHVMSVAQSLYEKQLITYPRTSSLYIKESELSGTITALDNLFHLGIFSALKKELIPDKFDYERIVEEESIKEHSAIVPTNEISADSFLDLTKDERNIFLLISFRLLMAVCPDYFYYAVEVLVQIGTHKFSAKGQEIISYGYRGIEKYFKSSMNFITREISELPPLELGDTLPVLKVQKEERLREPPRHYTDDTLLAAMCNAKNKVESDESVGGLKNGLGTPATRSKIIESMIAKGYISRDEKGALRATSKTIFFMPLIEPELRKPDLTGKWENKLNEIADGEGDPKAFMKEMEDFLVRYICYKKDNPPSKTELKSFEESKYVDRCPLCGAGVIEKEKVYACVNNSKSGDEKCKFFLFKTFNQKDPRPLTIPMLQNLIATGRTEIMSIPNPENPNKPKKFYLVYNRKENKIEWVYIKSGGKRT